MKFTKIVIRNIGAYEGSQNEFLFDTSNEHNVVLFGGKNGAGKTTLLEALRLVLFGPLTYGFMTDNEIYYQHIRSLLNRSALRAGEPLYQLILHYTAIENYEVVSYVISRSWILKKDKLKESFQVKRNGDELNDREIDNFENKLREEFPPRLFELCLFDGEEISKIISEGQIHYYLQEASKILFNLDLFVNLEKDLQAYQNNQLVKQETSVKLNVKAELEKKLQAKKKELTSLELAISTNKQTIEQHQEKIMLLKRDFDMHGGLLKEQRQILLHSINEIEHKRKINSDKIRSFVNQLLPFYLVRELIEEVDQQMEREKHHESHALVHKQLNKAVWNSMLKKIAIDHEPVKKEYASIIYKEILNLFPLMAEPQIHLASFEQRSEIRTLMTRLQAINKEEFESLFLENGHLLEKAQTLRKTVEENDRTSEFTDILEQIEELTRQIEVQRQHLEQKDQHCVLLNEEIRTIQSELIKAHEKLHESKKNETTMLMTNKLLAVSNRFRAMQLRKKLDQVEQEARKMINLLFRKKNYIHRLYIDHEMFDLTLFDVEGERIVAERLSAGEKEMLMLSIISAMFKVSGWKLPFVFDTLLGRLDQEHRKELIQQFIPQCGEQVIVLSTDSEISEDQFHYIAPILAHCYTLEFNQDLHKIEIIKDRYFNISVRELTHEF
ncbi:DNA sulfur modification protein DndD [Paenibacillus athensensis]|uniref:DNA sulfur modification protein DndD n=1 Tax=Paenibacillus athensensis TaxID=1967502 RepID=A0A4Y8PQZ9_9BACL|nr:DNA sulfur modification protein DndD [Paenibacillus athensensis]MCD1261999.1 DNA sulfur modification protein DndD [Paenibacillus athensensis]